MTVGILQVLGILGACLFFLLIVALCLWRNASKWKKRYVNLEKKEDLMGKALAFEKNKAKKIEAKAAAFIFFLARREGLRPDIEDERLERITKDIEGRIARSKEATIIIYMSSNLPSQWLSDLSEALEDLKSLKPDELNVWLKTDFVDFIKLGITDVEELKELYLWAENIFCPKMTEEQEEEEKEESEEKE